MAGSGHVSPPLRMLGALRQLETKNFLDLRESQVELTTGLHLQVALKRIVLAIHSKRLPANHHECIEFAAMCTHSVRLVQFELEQLRKNALIRQIDMSATAK